MKIEHGINKLLDASVTSGETSDKANVAAYQRKSVQLYGTGTAVMEASLDGTNWAPIHSGLDDANGTITAGKVYQLPRALNYVRATKSADASAVTVLLFVEGFDSI